MATKRKDNEDVEAGAMTPTADKADANVGRIPADEIAELVAEAEKAAVKPAKPAPKPATGRVDNDLIRSGRSETQVETQTIVEDRTDEPARKPGFTYEKTTRELDNGTILESYGDAKGDA